MPALTDLKNRIKAKLEVKAKKELASGAAIGEAGIIAYLLYLAIKAKGKIIAGPEQEVREIEIPFVGSDQLFSNADFVPINYGIDPGNPGAPILGNPSKLIIGKPMFERALELLKLQYPDAFDIQATRTDYGSGAGIIINAKVIRNKTQPESPRVRPDNKINLKWERINVDLTDGEYGDIKQHPENYKNYYPRARGQVDNALKQMFPGYDYQLTDMKYIPIGYTTTSGAVFFRTVIVSQTPGLPPVTRQQPFISVGYIYQYREPLAR